MKKLFLLLVAVLSIGLAASAQTRTVKGTVVDAANGDPLIGVSVTAANNHSMGVTTDADGDFTIVLPADVTRLTVSYVGYKTQNVNIGQGKLLVKLESSATQLQEVMAVAYGTVKKSEYTGSASVVKADQLEDALVTNVANALSGRMSGVTTLSANGQPGTQATVIIRGVGSINTSSEPLYVVDGMPYYGDLASISTSDIEAVTVLKDAASTALYGERGANGVVLITTKRGKEGQAKVTVDMRWGQNSRMLSNYDVISDSRQYLETYYQAIYNTQHYYMGLPHEAAANKANSLVFGNLGYTTWSVPDGQRYFSMDGKFNPNATPGYSNGRYYFVADNWTDHALIKGLRQEYNVSVTGGNERINYYVSGNYLDDAGIIYGSDFKRFSSRAAIDYQAKDWLKVGTSMMYSYSDMGYPGQQENDGSTTVNTFYFVNGIAPVYPMFVRDAEGNLMYNKSTGKVIYDYGDGHDYGNGLMGATRSQSGNPTGGLVYDITRFLMDVLDAKWYVQLTPIKGLVLTGNAGLFIDNTRYNDLSNPFYGQMSTYGGSVYNKFSHKSDLTIQGIAEYSHTFADLHNASIMFGYESEALHESYVDATGNNLYQPFVPYTNNTSDDIRGYAAAANLVHRAFLGRVRYNYAEKYFFFASMRRGASSRFAKDKRWGTFFSVSAGWDISKENFMADYSDVVDMLKFKASFGQNGNDAIGLNYIAYADQYKLVGSNGLWADGSLAYKGNPDITWEKSNAFNIGFDFSLWQGMLSGTLEYYNRQTSDMLFYLPVSPSLGYSSIPKNVGSMRNNGVEIDLNYRPINTKDITWEIFANATFQWNKVLKLAPEILTDGYWKSTQTSWLKEGEPMYQYYLVEGAGIIHNEDELAEIRDIQVNGNAVNATAILGQRLFWAEDADGNLYKTPNYQLALDSHRKCTGNLMPKVYGGFGTSLQAYGFDLSAQFAYQLGGRVIDYGYQNFMQPGTNVGMNMHKDLLNAWTPENPNTNVPALYTASSYNYATAITEDSDFIVSSNYLSLNNVTLGYTLPHSIVDKIKLGSVRVYCSGENLALWSRRKGLDPRQGFASSENYTYSPIRAISGGINVTF